MTYHLISEIKSNARSVKINGITFGIFPALVDKMDIPTTFCHKSTSNIIGILEDKIISSLDYENIHRTKSLVLKTRDRIAIGILNEYLN